MGNRSRYKVPDFIHGQEETKIPGFTHGQQEYPSLLFIQGPGYKIMKDLFLFMPNRIEKHLYFFFHGQQN